MVRVRSVAFTWNNYDESVVERLRVLDTKYLVAGCEVGASGTKHLQGTCVFKNARSLKAIQKLFLGAHVEPCIDVFASIRYCKKEGDFFECGVAPQDPKDQGDVERERWRFARVAAEEGRFCDIPDDLYTRYRNSYHSMHNFAVERRVFPERGILDNRWFYGPSGAGKSRRARDLFPGAFLKSKNKWWNGYIDQDVVIIDDVDPTMEWIGPFLKEWADHYPFNAEVKGGCRVIRPSIIVVTSQYTIAECFKDSETVSALKRRFKSEHFDSFPSLLLKK